MSSFRDGFPASKPESQASALGCSKKGGHAFVTNRHTVRLPTYHLLVDVPFDLFTIHSILFVKRIGFQVEMQPRSFLFSKRKNGKDDGENSATMTGTKFE